MKRAPLLLFSVFACAAFAAQSDETPRDDSSSAGVSRALETGSDVLMPRFRSLDKNGDGFLSKDEATAYPRARNGAFEQADVDGDGKLDAQEFKILHANTSEDRRLGSK